MIVINESLSDSDYGDVAFLVDKTTFLDSVGWLRKKWGIITLFSPDKFDLWLEKLESMRVQVPSRELERKKAALDKTSFDDNEEYEEAIERITIPAVDFDCDIRDLRLRFNRPDNFDRVISRAAVCGEVTKGIYEPTYWGIDVSHEPAKLRGATMRVVIYITPRTTQKDLLANFRKAKKAFNPEGKEWYTLPRKLYSKDVSGEIKRDRKWYWRDFNGETLEQIATSEIGEDRVKLIKQLEINRRNGQLSETERRDIRKLDIENKQLRQVRDYAEKVRKAIKRYQKALTTT